MPANVVQRRSLVRSALASVCCWRSLGCGAGRRADAELLWPRAPAQGDQPADKPTLTVFLPDEQKATGAAVVICPGGGYGGLATDHEGRQIAQMVQRLRRGGHHARISPSRPRLRASGPLAGCSAGHPHGSRAGGRVEDRPPENRHHGLFGRRTPGLDGRHAFRQGQPRRRRSHRARQLPARLPHPLLRGHRLR